MATTIISQLSPDDDIPTATLALPSIAAASGSRRLPPPCWTPEETVALIDAYRDKWYSLRRGNLRANHWQEVADDIASRCPADPPKTAVQCRHKMEKLRKRYRAEIHRAAAHGGVRRFTSSWAHFQNMQSMEKGTDDPTPPSSDDEEENHRNSIKRINDLYNHQNGIPPDQNPIRGGSAPGFRIRIPGGVTAGTSAAKGGQNPQNSNPIFNNYVASGYGNASIKDNSVASGYGNASNKVHRNGKRAAEAKMDTGVGEVAAAIEALGDGFMRMEKLKMEMVRQVEEMRMEMELKRTEMLLESQQRIVDTFAEAISMKKVKRKVDYRHPNC